VAGGGVGEVVVKRVLGDVDDEEDRLGQLND